VKIELIDDDLGLVAAGAALIDVHAACMQLVHLYLQCQTGVIDPLPCVYVRTYVRTCARKDTRPALLVPHCIAYTHDMMLQILRHAIELGQDQED
jgi:hypothetical protein